LEGAPGGKAKAKTVDLQLRGFGSVACAVRKKMESVTERLSRAKVPKVRILNGGQP
jgi:hypothetical protein